jgi:23S rRNA pseudouridine2605 synthase
MESKGERIAKVMARAGLCSRRDAEGWIADGRVSVNGKTLDSPACNVTEQDDIVVDGKALPKAERTRLFLYHKPAGLVTSARDEQGRDTVFGHLPKTLPRVISVGRLDLATEGLLLLTNDGGLSRYLELPSNGWERVYRVRAFGHVRQDQLDPLKDGITIDGVRYGSIDARLEGGNTKGSSNCWMIFKIKEGKNREIRRVLESLGLRVNRLIRQSYGPYELHAMKPGDVIEVPFAVMKKTVPGYFKS